MSNPRRLAGAVGAALALGLFLGACGGSGNARIDSLEATIAALTDDAPVEELIGEAKPTVPVVAFSATPLPDRNDCDAIRGTDYRSQAERDWFVANCISPTSTPPPAAPTSTPKPPAAQPPPAQPPDDPPGPNPAQAVVDQWDLCNTAWGEGKVAEATITAGRNLFDTTGAQIQFDRSWQSLQSNCVGIGGSLGSLPDASRWCGQMLGEHTVVSAIMALSQQLGAGTNSLQFELQELNGFISVARC